MDQSFAVEGNLHLAVAWTSGKSYEARQVKMGDEVAAALRTSAQSAASGLTDSTPYAPDADMEDNSHMDAPRDAALDTALIERLSTGASLTLATRDELTKTLLCHALVATADDGDVTLFVRKRSPIQLATKSLSAILANGTLDKIKSPIFAFDDRYDAIITPDRVYVLNKNAFELLFKNSDAVLSKTTEWVSEVAAALPLAEGSAETLDAALKRNSVLRNKLLALKRRPYLREITAEALRGQMAKYNLAPDEMMIGDQLKITDGNVKDVLRLLNEDLFTGGFSQQHYAASTKRSIG